MNHDALSAVSVQTTLVQSVENPQRTAFAGAVKTFAHFVIGAEVTLDRASLTQQRQVILCGNRFGLPREFGSRPALRLSLLLAIDFHRERRRNESGVQQKQADDRFYFRALLHFVSSRNQFQFEVGPTLL